MGTSVTAKPVIKYYDQLIKSLGSELKILLDLSKEEIEKSSLPEIADAVIKMREGNVSIEPGYDGVYGKIKIFPSRKVSKKKGSNLNQKTLF